jgi:PAS domain S-box-containing protein
MIKRLFNFLTTPMPLLVLLFLSLVAGLSPAYAVGLPPQQQQWLNTHALLRVGLVEKAPYVLFNGDSQTYQGADIDLLRLLEHQLGITLKPVVVPDETALERLGSDHAVDLVLATEQTPHRLRYWLFSQPYLNVPYLMVTRRNAPGYGTPADLKETAVALAAPDTLGRFLLRNYPILQTRSLASGLQTLHALHDPALSAALLDGAEARYWLRTPDFSGLRINGDSGFRAALRIGSREDWPLLSDIIDRALAAIPAQEMKQMERRWINPAQHDWWQGKTLWVGIALTSLLATLAFAVLAFNNRKLNRTIARQLQQREEELQLRHAQSMELLHAQFTMDHSPIGIMRLYWDGRVHYANLALCEALGLRQDQVQSMRMHDIDPAFGTNEWLEFWKSLRQKRFLSYESQHRCQDETLIPVEVYACLLSYDDHEFLELYVSDIRERQRIHQALEASEARLRELTNNVPGLVFQLRQPPATTSANLVYLSDACHEFCGYSSAFLLQAPRQLWSLIHPQDTAGFYDSMALALAKADNWNWQGRIVTALSQERWIDLKASRRRDARGDSIWDGMAWDITANKRTEQSLAESRWLLRELAAHHETLREKEKASIAREVHDELGQMLTALKMETSMCQMAVGDSRPDINQRLLNMKKSIDQTLQIARNVVTALRPPALDLGLVAALEWLAQRIVERLSLSCEVTVGEDVPTLDEGRAVTLFRIVQEALTNVARHANAQNVTIRLQRADEGLELQIEDDGSGFNPAAMSRSFGLVGIRERVWMLRGQVEVDSAPGQGTRIIVRIPLTF